MTISQDIENYHSLILNGTPFIDVRAPIEFSVGHLPTSHNFPILFDDERVAVGTCYKQQGREKAIALGHRLVSGDNRRDKITAWQDFYENHPDAVIYCARGGMRSKLSQSWLQEIGIELPRVHLGYKGLRNYLLSILEDVGNHPMLIVSGDTGTGKTELLQNFDVTIDLEGLANHHGSAFGKNITNQPTQATFENALAVNCIQKNHLPIWLLEDESRNIGKVHLPESLHSAMALAPVVVVEEPLEHRLQRISQLYFSEMVEKYRQAYGEILGWEKYQDYLKQGLFVLRKRLGLGRYTVLQQILDDALVEQFTAGTIDRHLDWLVILLTEYYDPMYQYQLNRKKERVIFRGDYPSICEFIKNYSPTL
ncbi:tRNA 2-selenouridine(34) synthase MnmH [Wohlfahrtiimonas larvae]|uniref:tRNA 2-selenouridine synthase n=1 Tax=Wohlfahrtiimonas larvae TaxID=1157986 RepID=A0ABP9MZX5_9GAMM|nr:tRNA 2-selenouridine(34) synthase MnmH [Wohlfahrtiimonas larvae]